MGLGPKDEPLCLLEGLNDSVVAARVVVVLVVVIVVVVAIT